MKSTTKLGLLVKIGLLLWLDALLLLEYHSRVASDNKPWLFFTKHGNSMITIFKYHNIIKVFKRIQCHYCYTTGPKKLCRQESIILS